MSASSVSNRYPSAIPIALLAFSIVAPALTLTGRAAGLTFAQAKWIGAEAGFAASVAVLLQGNRRTGTISLLTFALFSPTLTHLASAFGIELRKANAISLFGGGGLAGAVLLYGYLVKRDGDQIAPRKKHPFGS